MEATTPQTYTSNGKRYRLANSEDIGSKVAFSESASWNHTDTSRFVFDVLQSIDETESYPYIDIDHVAWRKAYVLLEDQ